MRLLNQCSVGKEEGLEGTHVYQSLKERDLKKETWVAEREVVVCYNRSQMGESGVDQTYQMLWAQVK